MQVKKRDQVGIPVRPRGRKRDLDPRKLAAAIIAQSRAKLGARVVPPYAMQLEWDPDDRIFVATVPELPGCRTHGRTRAEAVRNGEEAIAAWLGGAKRFGDSIPAPVVQRHEVEDDRAGDRAARLAELIGRLAPDEENYPAWVREEFAVRAWEAEHLPPDEQAAAVWASMSEPSRDWIKQHALGLISAYALLTGEEVPLNDLARRDNARLAAEGEREGPF